MTITVDTAPVGYDHFYETTTDGSTSGNVLTDSQAASDYDGDSLTAVLDSGPAYGSLNLNADGSFSYTPGVGTTGLITFTYRVSDGMLLSDPKQVTVLVYAVNYDDEYWMYANNTLDVDASSGVLANDLGTTPLFVYSVPTSTSHGSLSLNSDGSFTYTPDTDFTGDDTFTYYVGCTTSDGLYTMTAQYGFYATVTIHVW